jgi:hypothetical protein
MASMATLHHLQSALEHLRQLPASLWPEFQPSRIPVVAWDGVQTTLFQAEAAPSAGWTRGADAWIWHAWTWQGRHPELVAHTAVTLEGGLAAAGLMLTELPGDMTVRELAALVAHEAFHVYQASEHQNSHAAGWPERWLANELDVFGYPVTTEVLAARRLETLALRRALADAEHWPRHAAEALHWRHIRYEHLKGEHQTLERALERMEGLAYFTELEVSGQPPTLPQPDFAAEAIRRRCYSTGAALARMLDRGGEWKSLFMNRRQSLDELLTERLHEVRRIALDEKIILKATLEAEHESRRVLEDRKRDEQDFLAQPGPRLVIESAAPLWPQGFDPQNITELEGGRALHQRFLRFGHVQASGEVLGRAALTKAAGAHPLLHGFSSVILTGTANMQHSREGDVLHVRGLGFELQIIGKAEVNSDSQGWMIRLPRI